MVKDIDVLIQSLIEYKFYIEVIQLSTSVSLCRNNLTVLYRLDSG